MVQAVPVALEERRAPLELDRPEQHRLISVLESAGSAAGGQRPEAPEKPPRDVAAMYMARHVMPFPGPAEGKPA